LQPLGEPVEPPVEPAAEPVLDALPVLLPPDAPLPPLLADGVQTLFTQVPVQQSLVAVQAVPAPALGVSGMHWVQSAEMSQPVGQPSAQLPPSPAAVVGEQPKPARTQAARPLERTSLRRSIWNLQLLQLRRQSSRSVWGKAEAYWQKPPLPQVEGEQQSVLETQG
jgi:hypothetical protein